MSLYPISVNLINRLCLVVGGGKVAERKIKTLLRHGALVRLVSPQATDTLHALAADGKIDWRREEYDAHGTELSGTDTLDGVFLIMACTDNRGVNAAVTGEALARNLLVLCADDPDSGSFVTPAQIVRGDLTLTVSTGGGSPTLAAVLRERLEADFGPEWAQLVELISRQREFVKTNPNEAARKAAVRRVLDDPEVHALLRDGKHLEAEARIQACLF